MPMSRRQKGWIAKVVDKVLIQDAYRDFVIDHLNALPLLFPPGFRSWIIEKVVSDGTEVEVLTELKEETLEWDTSQKCFHLTSQLMSNVSTHKFLKVEVHTTWFDSEWQVIMN